LKVFKKKRAKKFHGLWLTQLSPMKPWCAFNAQKMDVGTKRRRVKKTNSIEGKIINPKKTRKRPIFGTGF